MSENGNNSDAAAKGTSTTTESWEFPGWGHATRIANLDSSPVTIMRLDQPTKGALDTWRSTAICGNDISSSVLYVSALCAAQAGQLAPVVLLIVGVVLYLYRKVYAEAGSALPLNGGTYTLLLNTTSKRLAAAAACLTLLSYIATAVISASDAMEYLHGVFPHFDIIYATIGLLGLFAVLNYLGITESANVALVIFLVHLGTLTVLALTSGFTVFQDPSLLASNWHMPQLDGMGKALFLGFAAAMLGISGFESSANFIEEQKPGVFPKTLRNMWAVVIIFNPLISLLSLGLLPLDAIREVPPDLLARMGSLSAGQAFGVWVSIDAVLVLSGAVLTSYVGVTGLARRMTLDRCLPQFLLRENTWRKTNHWIIFGFFGLATSILLITRGDLGTLAGVYTLAFLSVMALYAIGNMLLKVTRSRLPREVRAGWPTVIAALVAVLIALAGNILLAPRNIEVFLLYFSAALAVVGVMFLRIQLLAFGLQLSRKIVENVTRANEWLREQVTDKIEEINATEVVFFANEDNLELLNRAVLYVLKNEQTSTMKVVFVYGNDGDIPPKLAEHLAMIDRIYPRLRIDFVAVKGEFGPELIERLSRRLNVPKNLMFIATPGDRFPHDLEALGGVRVIL